MECKYCGRWYPDDRETGHGADDVCAYCAERDEEDSADEHRESAIDVEDRDA